VDLPVYEKEHPNFTEEEQTFLQGVSGYIEAQLKGKLTFLKKKQRRQLVIDILDQHYPQLQEHLKNRILQITAGYGKLDPLIEDNEIKEIVVNGENVPVSILHERLGKCNTKIYYTADELWHLIKKVEEYTGKRVADAYPILKINTPDNERITITLPGAHLQKSPVITIQKFKEFPDTIVDLLLRNMLTTDAASFLWMAIEGMGYCPLNIIIAGEAHSGKTTLLNSLLLLLPEKTRIITIEDVFELRLPYFKNWIQLDAGGRSQAQLIHEAISMQPERLVLGNIKNSSDAQSIISAMSYGIKIITNAYATSSKELITHFSDKSLEIDLNKLQSLDIIVCLKSFLRRGKNIQRVSEIVEVGGLSGTNVTLGSCWKYVTTNDTLVKEYAPIVVRDKIAQIAGISPLQVNNEISKRKKFLDWCVRQKLDAKEFVKLVQDYYKDSIGLFESLGIDIKDSRPSFFKRIFSFFKYK
jgi:flagellar protein FlaI